MKLLPSAATHFRAASHFPRCRLLLLRFVLGDGWGGPSKGKRDRSGGNSGSGYDGTLHVKLHLL